MYVCMYVCMYTYTCTCARIHTARVLTSIYHTDEIHFVIDVQACSPQLLRIGSANDSSLTAKHAKHGYLLEGSCVRARALKLHVEFHVKVAALRECWVEIQDFERMLVYRMTSPE